MLVNKLPGTNVVSADAIAPYLKPGTEWTVCPVTRAKYANFNLDDGPACRVHGKAYQLYISALADKDHPGRACALGCWVASKDPWNDQHSPALINGLISVVTEEQGKARTAASETLQRITRQNLGENAEAWQTWWQANRETFRFKP